MKAWLLVIDDEESICRSLKSLFESEGYDVSVAATAKAGLEAASSQGARERFPDVVLLDICLPDDHGLRVFASLKACAPRSQVIFMTAHGNVPQAVEAMKQGAEDYLLKPFNVDELLLRVEHVLKERDLKEQVHFLSDKMNEDLEKRYVRGPNATMSKVFEEIEVIANSPSTTVLIHGETGTGKEVIAQLIHGSSQRSHRPFVEVNATALTAELLESELFGHEAGAFTGATKAKKGLFEVAHGGTLFLDEIGDMNLDMQAKLLRAIQEKKIRRVGGTDPIEVDIRLVTATNKNLEAAVQEGSFREDLYYRLHVIPIHLPPLRERKDDIEAFVQHFIQVFNQEFGKQVKGVDAGALKALQDYPWPGNVRELRNVIERALLLDCQEKVLKWAHLKFLHEKKTSSNGGGKGDHASLQKRLGENFPLELIEREHIEGVLRASQGNKNQAAQVLGIDRTTLYNKLKKYTERGVK